MSGAADKLAKVIAPGNQASPVSSTPPPLQLARGQVDAVLTPVTCTIKNYNGDTATSGIPATNPPWATLQANQTVELLVVGTRLLVIGADPYVLPGFT